jgi:hypothetical protein
MDTRLNGTVGRLEEVRTLGTVQVRDGLSRRSVAA